MIKINNVTLKNFLSVGNATQAIRLDEEGLTLVLGSNTDANGGITKNGAGKSTLLQAISYALYGKPMTRVKIPNLVNNLNAKQMLVTIDFEAGGHTYRIERGQKPAVLRLFIDAKEFESPEDAAQGENKHTQSEIERILGLNHTLFKHIVALNTFTEPFFKMSAGDQRAIIEELLGATRISAKADVLRRLITQTKERIREQEVEIRTTTEANARIEATLVATEAKAKAWEVQKERRLADLSAQFEMLSAIDFDTELATLDAIDAWAQAQASFDLKIKAAEAELPRARSDVKVAEKDLAAILATVNGASTAQIQRLTKEVDRKRKDGDRLIAEMAGYRSEIVAIDADLSAADAQTCICCGQPIAGTDHLKTVLDGLEAKRVGVLATIEQSEKRLRVYEDEIAMIADEIEATKRADIRRAEEARLRESEAAQRLSEAQGRLLAAERGVASLKAEKASAGAKPSCTFVSRDEFYQARQMFETLARDMEQELATVNPFDGQIDGLRQTLKTIDYSVIDDLNGLLKHQDFLLRILTSKDSFVRKKIIDQNLSYLNTRLNHYLDVLGLPHEVKIMPDMSVDINLIGRDYDFEQLSRGEMNRVIMATSWSFRDVWESLNDSINLYLLDEVLDQGTDGQGAEAALAALKAMARDRKKNVFLISHRDELVGRIDRTIMVRKENGFSVFETGFEMA